MDNINDPITKEKSINLGCENGYHDFNLETATLGVFNGQPEMRVKCRFCQRVIGRPAPGVVKDSELPKEPEVVEEPQPKPEPEKLSLGREPLEKARAEQYEPPWARKVRDRFIKDKTLDNFWEGIKNK